VGSKNGKSDFGIGGFERRAKYEAIICDACGIFLDNNPRTVDLNSQRSKYTSKTRKMRIY